MTLNFCDVLDAKPLSLRKKICWDHIISSKVIFMASKNNGFEVLMLSSDHDFIILVIPKNQT